LSYVYGELTLIYCWQRGFPRRASCREIRVLPPECAEERAMPNFRCHMLDEHRDILFPADIVAETVSAAIRHAFEILESNNLSPLSFRQVYAFEVWNGDGRVFPEPPPKPTKFEELDRRSVSLSANAKALREAADAARDRSAILREMARTTRDAADEFRKQADAARKRREAR
jgi:hypothetical protein